MNDKENLIWSLFCETYDLAKQDDDNTVDSHFVEEEVPVGD